MTPKLTEALTKIMANVEAERRAHGVPYTTPSRVELILDGRWFDPSATGGATVIRNDEPKPEPSQTLAQAVAAAITQPLQPWQTEILNSLGRAMENCQCERCTARRLAERIASRGPITSTAGNVPVTPPPTMPDLILAADLINAGAGAARPGTIHGPANPAAKVEYSQPVAQPSPALEATASLAEVCKDVRPEDCPKPISLMHLADDLERAWLNGNSRVGLELHQKTVATLRSWGDPLGQFHRDRVASLAADVRADRLKPLDFDRLREINVARCEHAFHPLNSWSSNDWATAVAGEIGEMCNLSKKLHRQHKGDPTPGQLVELIRKEAGDVVAYLDLFCARLGINLGEAVRSKFNEVSERVGAPHRL